MTQLILLRHGQSMWNAHNLYTGWVDIPLSPQGIDEARQAGQDIQDQTIDFIFMSTLIRAQSTAMIAMAEHHAGLTPVIKHPEATPHWDTIHSQKSNEKTIPVWIDERLNERFYGDLQGLNKADTIAEHGAEQVKLWRRSFDTCPPNGESLAMTRARTLPCLKERIEPLLSQGQSGLICAHGNSLRAIIMEIEDMTPDEIIQYEIPTGQPLCYTYQDGAYSSTR